MTGCGDPFFSLANLSPHAPHFDSPGSIFSGARDALRTSPQRRPKSNALHGTDGEGRRVPVASSFTV